MPHFEAEYAEASLLPWRPCVELVRMMRPPCFCSDQHGPEGAQRVGCAGEIHVDDVVPVFVFHFQQRFEPLDTRVGNHDVQSAEVLRRPARPLP